ncbi:MerR family transcriptional regulator [Kutzneria buriramensis]|uniref:DNA-binding transcriptional MerR regulator n=1 Tax=Kutzneria buriramensis TaxID=1045776 RepID=A0A3E0HQL0_9PSEU|nr:MerR family transcriptional regulator [Kutzneria buriramensis]REH48699.1 DNA-binding transcriptional MerR regulator [Kutzneria buriramensis]
MNGNLSIGDLARLTGLTVKAIRFYSDRGIVPPTDRNPAGHRRYGSDAVARLHLVRTLRELGLDLATIRRVLAREATLAEVAAAHAEALAARIRLLSLHRAVLLAVAANERLPEETDLLHARRQLIDDFLHTVLDDPGIRRSMTPELPEDPTAEQLDAWSELVELTQDQGFRDHMRRLSDRHVPTVPPKPDLVALVRMKAGPATGLDPKSAAARRIVAAVKAEHGGDLARELESANDPRRDRYLRLLAVINGWAEPEDVTPAVDWFLKAM